MTKTGRKAGSKVVREAEFHDHTQECGTKAELEGPWLQILYRFPFDFRCSFRCSLRCYFPRIVAARLYDCFDASYRHLAVAARKFSDDFNSASRRWNRGRSQMALLHDCWGSRWL